jgi:phenylpropionate dioxygenase-like ring-hydroxylating dioxygenase large terminal subunit
MIILPCKAWTPIGSIHSLESIQRVTILEKDYVVWKTEDESFVVQSNTCPHRLAPLSEGRIVNNNIECGYHGWRFDTKGNLIKIPQAREQKVQCPLITFETRQTGDILWADLTGKTPENFWNQVIQDSVLSNATIPYVREVPYSWNYLIENLFDPAHVPFAHHGMQSVRNDACPIPMQLLHFTPDKLEFYFRDRTMGKERDGLMEFCGPYLYRLKIREENQWTQNLTILCIPIKSGRSRVMVCSNKPMTKEERIKNHDFSNQFFQTDDYLVHYQEVNSGNESYHLLTSSDTSIRHLHKWLKKFYPQWIYQNRVILEKEKAIDNERNHIQFCKDCQNSKT